MFQPEQNPETKRIYELANKNGYQVSTGEVFPSDLTALVIGKDKKVQVVGMKWGFPGFEKGQTLINARAETAGTKKTFANSFKFRRAVYPTTGFFEWTSQKDKVYFNYDRKPSPLYIGGFYNYFDGQPKSILLTTEPNSSVRRVHNRMPLLLRKDQIKPWLSNEKFAKMLSKQPMPNLFGVETNKK